MNYTRLIPHASHAWRWGALMILAMATLVWFGGCADPRTEPLQQSTHGYSETIVLWMDQVSNGQAIDATFEVKDPLSESTEAPARLFLIAYIRPDGDINWYESIISDSIPPLVDQMTLLFIELNAAEDALDSLFTLDSMCTANPDTCTLLGINPDTLDYYIAQWQADTVALHGSVNGLVADTTELGLRRDSLGRVVDDRFVLTLWLDDDTTATVPEAIYVDTEYTVAGQGIYLAATDTNGYKGREFELNLKSFDGAASAPEWIGEPYEYVWTCNFGETDNCLFVGTHTLRASLSGTDTRITATLLLTYAENTP